MKTTMLEAIKELHLQNGQENFNPSLIVENTVNWCVVKVEEDFDDVTEILVEQNPEIMTDEYEELDAENFLVIGLTDDVLTVLCGGDWQYPRIVELVWKDNSFFVTRFYKHLYESFNKINMDEKLKTVKMKKETETEVYVPKLYSKRLNQELDFNSTLLIWGLDEITRELYFDNYDKVFSGRNFCYDKNTLPVFDFTKEEFNGFFKTNPITDDCISGYLTPEKEYNIKSEHNIIANDETIDLVKKTINDFVESGKLYDFYLSNKVMLDNAVVFDGAMKQITDWAENFVVTFKRILVPTIVFHLLGESPSVEHILEHRRSNFNSELFELGIKAYNALYN